MSNHFENINPWAEKLEMATVPELAPSWRAMQVLLDNEMPVTKVKDWRRWALLCILLLLLIGVCNCPIIRRTNMQAEKKDLPFQGQSAYNKDKVTTKRNVSAIEMKNESKTAIYDSIKINSDKKHAVVKMEAGRKTKTSKGADSLSVDKNKLRADNNRLHSEKTREPVMKGVVAIDSASRNSGKKTSNFSRRHAKKKFVSVADNKIVQSSTADEKKINKNLKKWKQPEISAEDSSIVNADSSVEKTSAAIKFLNSKKPIDRADSAMKKQKTISKLINDSSAKKAIKADSTLDAKGLLLALGLNQFFPVGNQEKSSFNSSGTSGGIGDYIPVPVARYYLHKWLYFQAEVQFNTPQYTKTLLASQTTLGNGSGADTSKSVFIKKLFYFNLPVSVHYSPLKNFYIGGGLEYSMLTNGVALFQNAKASAQNPVVLPANDTLLISAKLASFKNTPVYRELKTYEFRFLFDINYQWKPLTLGLRYNQAFTNFINVHVSNVTITQAHNASLQLFLRYTIWDHRKKISLPK